MGNGFRSLLTLAGLLLAAFCFPGCFRGASASGPVFFDAAQGLNRINTGKTERGAGGTLVWTGAYFGVQESMDWTGYDIVEVTLMNPGTEVIPCTFEVKDKGSESYWTRVNQPQSLGPGFQILRLPTRLSVGEPARPGRALDRASVRSLILSRDEKHRERVEIRKVELKKAVPFPMPPGARAFDVGPEDTPVFDGLEALTEKTDYNAARGFGWTEKHFWTPYPQLNRLFGPDRLTGDNLTIASAKLRVDLKPGRYRVALIIDHPGGFWGEFPFFHRRTVRSQGRLAFDERETPRDSERRYFEWEDREDREGDDLFERYWDRILKEKTFETRVEPGGHLELAFENEGCPGKVSCFGIALSSLALLPIDTPEQEKAAKAWLAELHDRRHREFNDQFKLSSRRLTDLLAGLPSGLNARDVDPALDLSLAAAKDTLSFEGPRALRSFRNARAIFAPLVSWKGSGPRTLAWRVEGLPLHIGAEGGWIQFRALRDSYTGNQYSVRERWVSLEGDRVFAAEDLGRLWLRFDIPKDAKPGQYPATLVIFAREGSESLKVPFMLNIRKGAAADLDFPVGPFFAHIQENWWDEATLRPRLDTLEERSLKLLRGRGLTSFSFSPRIGVTFKGEQAVLETQEVDRIMRIARPLGFQGVVGYDSIFKGASVCAMDSGSLLADPKRFMKVVAALEARAEERHWLPLTLVICDEPIADDVAKLASRLEAVKISDPSRRVQWSVTTSLGKNAGAAEKRLVSHLSLPFLQAFSKDDLHAPWGYYNDASRSSLGLRMFDLRESSDLRYRMVWAYNVNSANPYFSLDSREDDIAWCSSLESAKLRCTVELDRVVDTGLTDYRIALALKRAVAASKDEALKAEGERLLREASGEHVDPDAWRSKAGDLLERL